MGLGNGGKGGLGINNRDRPGSVVGKIDRQGYVFILVAEFILEIPRWTLTPSANSTT